MRATDTSSSATATGDRWRAIAFVAAAAAIDLLLLDRAGFIIASTVFFWVTARAFDAGHPFRDLGFAVAISVASYVVFVRWLNLSLPAGVLAGWL